MQGKEQHFLRVVCVLYDVGYYKKSFVLADTFFTGSSTEVTSL